MFLSVQIYTHTFPVTAIALAAGTPFEVSTLRKVGSDSFVSVAGFVTVSAM